MKDRIRQLGAVLATLALIAPGVQPVLAQSPAQSQAAQSQTAQQNGFVLKVNGELVLTNVVVRDSKTGEVVRGLKQSDFSIYENGKQQQIATFDFESVDQATPLNEATVSGLAAGGTDQPQRAARSWRAPRICAITA